MSAIHQFLHELRWLVLLITLPTALFYSWKIWLVVSTPSPQQPRTGTVRRPQPRPAGAPPSTTSGVQTNLLDKTTAASTAAKPKDVRVGSGDVRPDTKPVATDQLLPKRSDDDEVGKLFDGLDDSLTPKAKTPPGPPKAVGERVSRLEELGFHHSIPKEQVKPTEAPADSRAGTAAPTAPVLPPARPSTEAEAPQLDDILARLDKVLGDDGDTPKPSAPAAAPVAEAPRPATEAPRPSTEAPKAPTTQDATAPATPPKAPAWARPDVTDEDLDGDKPDPGRQLGLFDERKKTDDKA